MMQATVRIIVAAGVALAAFAGPSVADDRDQTVPAKMLRQIGVMEKIVDKVLLDSPNFLVRVDDNTRGLYIPEYGVIFTLDASLTGGSIPDMSKMIQSMKNRFEIKTDKNGNETITIHKDKDKGKDKNKNDDESSNDEQNDSTPPEPPTPSLPPSVDNWVISGGGKQAADLYAAGKDELIQALLDYGDTLTSLHSGQRVMIAAFLRDNDYFKENKISRLVLKASIDDLRAYGEGKLSEKEARSRIGIEQY